MLDIIYGENSNAPAARQLQAAIREVVVDGTLYLGYPVLATADAKVFVDALLLSARHGLVAFDLSTKAAGNRLTAGEIAGIQDRQDQIHASIHNKLNSFRELRDGRRLALDIKVVTCVPNLAEVVERDEVIIAAPEQIGAILEAQQAISENIFRVANAAIQRVSTLRPPKKRQDVEKDNSRGAILKKIEGEIANLDGWQSRGAIEYTNGPQRIRGLAGSGKTVVLALKAAYLHARHPEWTIVITFNTRSLYQQFKDLVRRFMFDQVEDEPDWDKLLVLHAWGSTREPGVYSTVASSIGMSPLTWKDAEKSYVRPFDGACSQILEVFRSGVKAPKLFDAVLVDEAQDLPTSFFQMVYAVTEKPKRVIWAYDDLQNLGDYEMPSEKELFGSDSAGRHLVLLKNEPDQPKEDIVLPVCYRNTPWALASAHALGFGIYRPEGLVQMFEEPSIWPRIGYEVVEGDLALGSHVRVRRKAESYPQYFLDLLRPEDAVSARTFSSADEQYKALATAIKKNLTEDELEPSDILVVLPDTWTSKSVGSRVMSALMAKKVVSHLAGVTTSRDEIFRQGSVAITHIHRAKGNEAAMVYVVNAEYCHAGFELNRRRNVLFTAITRSRSWVRIFGVGDGMKGLERELQSVRDQNYELDFQYPSKEEIQKLSRVHRDMTAEELQAWTQKVSVLEDVARAVADGDVSLDSLPADVRKLFEAAAKKASQE